ncbi:MAG: flagellar hook capping FlgD N-terminal domain-containing protein [Albidovulum sp.]
MDVASVTSAKPITQSQTDAAKVSGDYEMFLKMLTAQMKNQDPLNPVDSTDYATQLATFSGVEQQVKTNQLLEALAGQNGASGMAQYASWVGMEARAAVPVDFHGQKITLQPAPADGADKTVLVAFDAQNRAVSRQEINVSNNPINWTGTDNAGNAVLHGVYSFQLESYQAGKIIANDKVEVYGKITETRQDADGAVLVMESGATVSPSDIKALRQASTS